MKILVTALTLVVSLIWLAPGDAEARNRGYRKKAPKVYSNDSAYRRPASVAANGLCQRDTGTPTGQLNFRNKCDTEEFWLRNQRGSGRR